MNSVAPRATSSLPDGVQGARRPSLEITWYRDNGWQSIRENLTGALLTGLISNGNVTRPITGTIAPTDAALGVFRWDMSDADVAEAGSLQVQFIATYASGQSPAKSFAARWTVRAAL